MAYFVGGLLSGFTNRCIHADDRAFCSCDEYLKDNKFRFLLSGQKHKKNSTTIKKIKICESKE